MVLALLAAISYGVGDFVGGIGGRRTVAAFVPLAIQIVGVLFTAGAVLVGFGASPTIAVLAWGALSGIGSGVGNAALLRGLARGRMSVVAPLSAVVTAAVPAVVGLLTGDHLAWWGFEPSRLMDHASVAITGRVSAHLRKEGYASRRALLRS